MDFKNFVIGIAIMILTISVVVYGVNTFYSSPDYEDFCPDVRRPSLLDSENETEVCPAVCVEMWEIDSDSRTCVFNECGSGCGPDGETSFETLKHCEVALSGENCWGAYEDEREKYSRNLFLIALPIGIAVVALGAIVFGLEAVGAGLMAGGVGIIFWGVGGFWRFADDWLKFILSFVGLVVLIWLAYYFNKSFSKKVKKSKGKKR
ncbi:MAG: hypothetical protein WDZ69_02465 [Candidatus Pacearchaeota archaeon]